VSGARWYPVGFDNPFVRNGCVPLAFTALQPIATRTADFALSLARQAQRTRARDGDDMLLNRTFGSPATQWRIHQWAALAGLRVVETFKPEYELVEAARTLPGYHHYDDDGNRVPLKITTYRRVGRPTVAQFIRGKGRKGRWLILTKRHAQACINGRLRGSVSKRDRVHFAARVDDVVE
jgi:hypothetical protein